MSFDDPHSQLRARGLQVTAQRLAVLRAVAAHPHGTAEVVAEAVRGEIGAISRQAVYDSLGVLSEKGLIRRIQPAGSPALFDPRVGDDHHHAVCRACRAVFDVDGVAGAASGLVPLGIDPAGADFDIERADVVFWGMCAVCRSQPDAANLEPSSD